jgi:hypothetical protein
MICFLPADVNENHLAAFRHSYALVTENHIRQINYLTTAVSNRKFQKCSGTHQKLGFLKLVLFLKQLLGVLYNF